VLNARLSDVIMTTSSQIPATLRTLKNVLGWNSLHKKPVPPETGAISLPTGREHFQSAPRGKPSLDARIAAEELLLAAHIHSELMSIRLPHVSYASIHGKTMPCRAIGGDFFDAIELNDALCAVVADVSGKGTPAAIVAAMLQGIIHAQMLADRPLAEIAAAVNEFLCSRTTGKFATMVLLKVYANGTAEYVNCGHIPPVLVSAANARRLEGNNLVVGVVPAARYASESCSFSPGDRVLIFTDGITEAENQQGEQFGDLSLESWTRMNGVDSIFDGVAKFQGSLERSDDWTLFELRYQGGQCGEGRSI
jgi:serine phosphatase RsbU (regulator of sigma subunit)